MDSQQVLLCSTASVLKWRGNLDGGVGIVYLCSMYALSPFAVAQTITTLLTIKCGNTNIRYKILKKRILIEGGKIKRVSALEEKMISEL